MLIYVNISALIMDIGIVYKTLEFFIVYFKVFLFIFSNIIYMNK